MPLRESPHHEIEILMSFSYLKLFKAKEDPEEKSFLFKIEDEEFIYVGHQLI